MAIERAEQADWRHYPTLEEWRRAMRHDSECESRRDVHHFDGSRYCASCGALFDSRDAE
jgi:hypothetical protein